MKIYNGLAIDEYLQKRANAFIDENKIDRRGLAVVREYGKFEVKAMDSAQEEKRDGIWIKGYLSTFKNADRENDVVAATAFDESIRDIMSRGGKLPMLRDHRPETICQIGSWSKFVVDQIGLFVEGFITKTRESEHIISLIRDGHLDTLSMGGIFKYADVPDAMGRNQIVKVYLLEGTVTPVPANPMAQFTMKSLSPDSENGSQVPAGNGIQVPTDRAKSLFDLYTKKYGGKP